MLKSKVKLVSKMLKAIHYQESKEVAREKAEAVICELKAMKLKEAVKMIEDCVEETLTYCVFPFEQWTRIHTNNVIERLNLDIRPRTRVVGAFPDGTIQHLCWSVPGCAMWPEHRGAAKSI